jgi:hypothetical protein
VLYPKPKKYLNWKRRYKNLSWKMGPANTKEKQWV